MIEEHLYDPSWPPSQRMRVAVAMLAQIQLDIPAGRYSQPKRMNCQSVIHVLQEPAKALDSYVFGSRSAFPVSVRKALGWAWK